MRTPLAAAIVVGFGLSLAAACGKSPSAPTTPTATVDPQASAPPPSQPTNPTTPPPTAPSGPPLTPITPTGQSVIVTAVGDIGLCGSANVPRVARVLERFDGPLILAGDLAYMHGSMQDYLRCFDPFWGQFRRRWRPVPGNHEYETPGAAGYFQYFAEAGSHAGRSYYAFRAGDWQVLMLDSNIPTAAGSAQFQFVQSALLSDRTLCTMAVWHHPLFSSGPNGPNVFMRDIWRLLYDHDADLVVAGHDHLYERFGKQDVDGRSDPRGLRQFIAGTGGANLYDFMRMEANSQVRLKSHGVLRLTLHSTNYEWAFLDANGATADAGSDGCH